MKKRTEKELLFSIPEDYKTIKQFWFPLGFLQEIKLFCENNGINRSELFREAMKEMKDKPSEKELFRPRFRRSILDDLARISVNIYLRDIERIKKCKIPYEHIIFLINKKNERINKKRGDRLKNRFQLNHKSSRNRDKSFTTGWFAIVSKNNLFLETFKTYFQG